MIARPKDCRFSELSVWVSGLDSNCWDGYSLRTLNQEGRVDWMAQRTHALLAPQGSLSVLRGRAVCPLVLAVLVRGMRAEIPLFFVGQFDLQSAFTAIATLLIFRKAALIGFLTKRVKRWRRFPTACAQITFFGRTVLRFFAKSAPMTHCPSFPH